jgi:mannose-1-phosphate guanylyltransferase
MTEKHDFPKMLFHVVEKPIVVNDEEEQKLYAAKGWQETSVVFDAYNLLKAKIAYYEDILHDLYRKLERVKKDGNIEDPRDEAVEPCDDSSGDVPEAPVKAKKSKKK